MSTPEATHAAMSGHTAPAAEGRAERAGLLACAAPMIEASMCRQHARGVLLDTMAFYVLDPHDALALALAGGIWRRFGGPSSTTLAARPRPPILIGSLPVDDLADLAASAGDAYAEAVAALQKKLLPNHAHVLVVAAGGIDLGALHYGIEQPAAVDVARGVT